jgi:hypothetical protein
MNNFTDESKGTKGVPHNVYYQALHTYVTGPVAQQSTCTPGGPAGSLPADSCVAPQVCGVTQANSTMTPGKSGYSQPVFTCGKLLGFWSTDQICGTNPIFKYQFPGTSTTLDCGLDPGNTGNTVANWFGCNGAGSAANTCYGQDAKAGCCGCPLWFVLSPNNGDAYCGATSQAWTDNVQKPSLIWMKQGCSSTYTFPYDDATSTFNCSSNSIQQGQVVNAAGLVNTQDYTVTFCPDNNQGSVNGNPVYVKPDGGGRFSLLHEAQMLEKKLGLV